ncbi:MAG: trypsin-like peptidase domain-containing protein [Phycisphaerales bacterium]
MHISSVSNRTKAAGLIAAILAIAGLGVSTHADTLASEVPPVETIEREQAMVSALELSAAFRHAAETIEPSVVHIIIERNNRRGFRQQAGVGSGVIVGSEGYVLTNNHVTESGQSIKVRLSDGRELEAEIVGAFAETDLAVLKIEAEGLVSASFGDSEALGVGEWVLAVGSPFGFEQTVTAGIISAKGRGSIDPRSMEEMPGRFQEFLQTDAAINPGNSGGPLVNLEGQIVGINTAIASSGGGSNGLGFAIPADIAATVMDRIIRTGRVGRGWLGVNMDQLDPSEAIELGVEGGVVVVNVLEDSPADRADLENGDVIVSIGGRATETVTRLSNAIMLAEPDMPTTVVFFRDGQKQTAIAVLDDRDTAQAIASGGARLDNPGLIIQPATLSGRRSMPIAGFRVTDVLPGTLADASGFEPDDFIYEIDGQRFETAQELAGYFQRAQLDSPVRIGVIRGNQSGAIYLRESSDE